MALTQSTGWLGVSSGSSRQVVIPGTAVVSARARWKGRSVYDNWDGYSSGLTSASFPSPPPGYVVTGGSAQFSVTINAGWYGATGYVSVSAPGGSKSVNYDLGPNVSQTISVQTSCDGSGTAQGSYSISGSGGASNPSVYVETRARKTTNSSNPSMVVGGESVVGPASLADGAVSDWYEIPAGALLGGANDVLSSIGGSGIAYLEIEYTYQPYPPPPERQAPQNLVVTDDRTPTFEFALEAAEGSDSVKHHGRIVLSRTLTLGSPIIADSSVSQEGWSWWDGLAWQPMPAVGVDAGTLVRYEPTDPMGLGVWYWAAVTRDEWGIGLQTTSWILRVVLSVDALEGYSLAIESEVYPCLDLEINLACNGKIGTIAFSINNMPDESGVRNDRRVHYGDEVSVSLYDDTGHVSQYLGRIWQKNPGDVTLGLVATLGDKVLADRILKADYLNQDLGGALVAAVEARCPPLLATGIPNPLGITVNMPFMGKQVIEMFEEAMRTWGLRWYVQTEATDQVVYVVDPLSLQAQGILVRYGDGHAG